MNNRFCTTSWVDVMIDEDEAEKLCRLFEMRGTDGRARYDDPALDGMDGCLGAVVESSGGGKALITAMPREFTAARAARAARAAGSDLAVSAIKWGDITPATAVNLLLTMIPKRRGRLAKGAGTALGKLLVLLPFDYDADEPELTNFGEPAEIAALEVGCSQTDLGALIAVSRRSFTNLDAISDGNMTFSKGKTVDSYPRYSTARGRVIRVKEGDEEGREHRLYIPRVRKTRPKRNITDYLGVGSLEAFEDSRLALLHDSLDAIREEFPFARIEFRRFPVVDEVSLKKGRSEKAPWRGMDRVNIVVDSDNEKLHEAADGAAAIISALGTNPVFDPDDSETPQMRFIDSLIRINALKKLHDRPTLTDRYPATTGGVRPSPPIQHMTELSLRGVASRGAKIKSGDFDVQTKDPMTRLAGFESGLKELWIKQQCANSRIDEWEPCEWEVFAVPSYRRLSSSDHALESLSLIKIADDGTFSFTTYNRDEVPSAPAFARELFRAAEPYRKRLEAIAVSKSNEIIGFERTGARGMPDDLGSIARKLREEEIRSVKNKPHRDLFESVLDIKLLEIDGSAFYLVGERLGGLHASLAKGPAIRRIVQLSGDAKKGYDELLGLLDVDYVRLRRPTVVPYPVKFVRETALMQGVDIDEESSEEDEETIADSDA